MKNSLLGLHNIFSNEYLRKLKRSNLFLSTILYQADPCVTVLINLDGLPISKPRNVNQRLKVKKVLSLNSLPLAVNPRMAHVWIKGVISIVWGVAYTETPNLWGDDLLSKSHRATDIPGGLSFNRVAIVTVQCMSITRCVFDNSRVQTIASKKINHRR